MPDKKVVFHTEWFDIEEEFFHGKPWYRVVEPNAVCMLVMTKNNKIILVRQFRPIVNEYTLELPAGHLDKGEGVFMCARRELYEETGYVCDRWVELASDMIILASRSTMRSDLFLGLDAVYDSHFAPKEDIEVELVNLREFKHLIMNGKCKQNIAAGAIQLASWRGLIPDDF